MAVTLGEKNMARTKKKLIDDNNVAVVDNDTKTLDTGASPAIGGQIDSPPAVCNNEPVSSIMGQKYRDSYAKMYDALPKWKKLAVNECKAINATNDNLYEEFIKSVIADAERV